MITYIIVVTISKRNAKCCFAPLIGVYFGKCYGPESERPYFQQSAPILARNPKTILRNTEYTPILRRLFEKRAKIGAECPK